MCQKCHDNFDDGYCHVPVPAYVLYGLTKPTFTNNEMKQLRDEHTATLGKARATVGSGQSDYYRFKANEIMKQISKIRKNLNREWHQTVQYAKDNHHIRLQQKEEFDRLERVRIQKVQEAMDEQRRQEHFERQRQLKIKDDLVALIMSAVGCTDYEIALKMLREKKSEVAQLFK